MISPVHGEMPDLIPQAIVNRPVASIVERWGDPRPGEDDLDVFEGLCFCLDDDLIFAVRHYRGHPTGTSTLYLDPKVSEVEAITDALDTIFRELGVSDGEVGWQRRDDPDL